MRLPVHILVVVALAVLAPAAAAATRTTAPDPQQLWNAYPLNPGDPAPRVQLPASSAQPRPRPETAAANTAGRSSSNAPSWLIVAAIGVCALLIGAVAGRRRRRPEVVAATPIATAAPAATPRPLPPPRRAPPPRPAAEPVMPPPPAPPPVPAAPGPARVPEAAAAPVPGGRFRRVPWPNWAQGLWRCEITHHRGLVHATFRAVAYEPGGGRGVELGRSGPHIRPGWGVEAENDETREAVGRIARALQAAGWQPTRPGRDWYSVRFVWPRPEDPPTTLDEAHDAQESADA